MTRGYMYYYYIQRLCRSLRENFLICGSEGGRGLNPQEIPLAQYLVRERMGQQSICCSATNNNNNQRFSVFNLIIPQANFWIQLLVIGRECP